MNKEEFEKLRDAFADKHIEKAYGTKDYGPTEEVRAGADWAYQFIERLQNEKERKWFPIISERGAKPHPTRIPSSIADLAYSVYSSRYGRDQSLEKLGQRGGFYPSEMDDFLPDWRQRCDDIERLERENQVLRDAVTKAWDFLERCPCECEDGIVCGIHKPRREMKEAIDQADRIRRGEG